VLEVSDVDRHRAYAEIMAIGPDVVDVLVEDHREIEALLCEVADRDAELAHPENDPRLSVTIAELARHIVVEEEYLYPVVREIVPNGDRMAADGLSLSLKAERLMKQLERSASSAADQEPIVAELLDVVRRHVETTERDLFPALRQVSTPERLGHLAGVVEMAKRTAPTRAHPGAPAGTPWNQILSPGIGLVDKIRDSVTGRATRPEDL
jgi:hemerythrin-like domain-containing protein